MTGAVAYVHDGSPGSDAAVGPRPLSQDKERDFTAFYERQYGPVTGYALSLVGDAGVAADVAQEAFTRLYLRWGKIRDPRAWLFFIVTNLTRDHWRAVTRDRGLAHSIGVRGIHSIPAHDPWLRDLVERLPDRLREPVLLHYWADLPIEDVARLMHRPVGTIKQRLHQARKDLAAATQEIP